MFFRVGMAYLDRQALQDINGHGLVIKVVCRRFVFTRASIPVTMRMRTTYIGPFVFAMILVVAHGIIRPSAIL
jgi:hypothetical protein